MKARLNKSTTKPETELEDFQVERVDGVGTPATGIPFLLLKAEDSDELRANAEVLAQNVLSVLRYIHKSGLALDETLAAKLNKVATLLGVNSLKFEARDSEESEVGEETEAAAAVEKAKGKAKGKKSKAPMKLVRKAEEEQEEEKEDEDAENEIEKAINKVLKKNLAPLIESTLEAMLKKEIEQASNPPTSKQDILEETQVKKSEQRKMGSGLFADVIMRRPTWPGQ